jgi:hypothetical protein
MQTHPLNAVQQVNYTTLSAIRDVSREDLGAACCSFGLTMALAKAIRDLTPDKLMSVVVQFGNQTLFCPRADLEDLLAAPPAMRAVLASARASVPSEPASEPATEPAAAA